MYTSNFVICCRYFSLQASHPLGFDDKTRFEVEGNICREEGPLPSCFAKTHHIAFRTIEKVFNKRYKDVIFIQIAMVMKNGHLMNNFNF